MLKFVLIALVVLFVLIIGIFWLALAPTIRNLSDKPVFRQWIGVPLILQHPGMVYIHPGGSYRFYPQVLTERRDSNYQLKYELPVGSVIFIKAFKTYTSNAGSGTTSLFALGEFATKDGKIVSFEYSWTYEDLTSLYGKQDKLPLAIWQKTGEPQVDNIY
jgi:hypothetical protein